MPRFVGYSLTGLGIVLLVICSLGQWTSLGDYRSFEPGTGDSFDAQMAAQTRSVDELWSYIHTDVDPDFDALPPAEKMQILFSVVCKRFTHGDQSENNLFSNWLLWVVSLNHAAFRSILVPDDLLKWGHSGLCHQSSYVLVVLAWRAGIEARHVGLTGHVVMEAFWDHGWHMFDPDQEVVARGDGGKIYSGFELGRNPDLVTGFYPNAPYAVDAFCTREDNTYMTYPPKSYYNWMVHLVYLSQRTARVLKWVIPVLFLVWGGWILWRKRAVASPA